MRPPSGRTGRDIALLAGSAACWGLGTVVSKRATDEMPALVVLPIQLAVSVFVLVVLMNLRRVPLVGAPPALVRLGLLNPGLAYALGLIGLTYIPASVYVLLWAAEPPLILLLAGVFLGEGITARFVGLSVVAAFGMAVVLFEPSAAGQWPGVVLTLAGVACCAAYSVLARRWVASSDSTLQVVLGQQAYALGFALIVALLLAAVGGMHVADVSAGGLASAAVSGVLYYAAAYWLYLTALRRVPVSVASSAFYLIPVFGVAASLAFLGERLNVAQWIGVAIVVVAVVSIVRLPVRERRGEAAPAAAS